MLVVGVTHLTTAQAVVAEDLPEQAPQVALVPRMAKAVPVQPTASRVHLSPMPRAAGVVALAPSRLEQTLETAVTVAEQRLLQMQVWPVQME